MSRSVPPPDAELPEPAVRQLQALYREAATAEPEATLDRKILDAARAGLQADRRANAGRRAPWWKRWLPLTSAVALLLVGLSLAWRVMDEQERHLREEIEAARSAGEASRQAAPAQRPAEARPSVTAPAAAVERSRRAESTANRDSAPAAPEPAAPPAAAAPAAIAPRVSEQAMKKSRDGGTDELRERRDAGAAADAASGAASPAGKLEAKSLGAGPSREAAPSALAKPSVNSFGGSLAQPAATPEAWLQQIRELRAAGRNAEAVQSLARFRARYPDFVLPEDLLQPR